MNAPVLLIFLVGTHIATGAVILRDASSGIPVEILEHPNEIISISQNYENTFSSGVSSSSFETSGLPQYLHQGNNVFYHPQILLPGTNTPSVLVVPVPEEKEKADCEQHLEGNGMYGEEIHKEEGQYEEEKHKDEGKYDDEKHKDDGKYEGEKFEEEGKYEADKHEEEGKYKETTSAPHLEQEVINDEVVSEIPSPPELPPLTLPELPQPLPTETTEAENPKKEEGTSNLPDKNNFVESVSSPINDELPNEDNKPLVIPAPPELPPLVLPELPVKVTVQVPIQPPIIQAPAIPCEQPIEITVPAKPVTEIPKEQDTLPLIPPAPVAISIENNVINNESPKLDEISLNPENDFHPIIISVIPSYPQYPAIIPSPSLPQFPLNFGLSPNVPADVPPCPPQFPQNAVLQVHDYVNQLGPQYQIIPVPPYKK